MKGTTEEMVGKNNSRLLKCAITDQTNVLQIMIWEDEIENIKDGCVYLIHGVGVRFRGQSKYLTTTRVSRIIEADDEALKQLDDSTAVVLLLPPSDTTVLVESLRSVNIEIFQSCIGCSAKIPSAIQTKILKCLRCGDRMRFQDCKLEVAVKITVVDENDSTLSLTIFSKVIEKFLGVNTTVLSADEIAEKLLLLENLKI